MSSRIARPSIAPSLQRTAKLDTARPVITAAPATRVEVGPVDGTVFVKQALTDIARRTLKGEKVRVVFDIDNTLADTRARTAQIAHSWDAANGTHHFDRLTTAMVGKDARDTCLAMDLPLDVINAFETHWNEAFWDGANFVHDAPMESMVQLARQASAAGAQVVFLTGRLQSLEKDTIAQLKRFGLDANASLVMSKPSLDTRTAAYKAEVLARWQSEGFGIGFFVTEGRRDTAAIQKALPNVATVLLDSSMGGSEPVSQATPTLPRLF